jgi:hypothetical protein
MKDCKIRTFGIAELSEKIQKELFRMECKWKDGSKTIKDRKAKYLYIRNNAISFGVDRDLFNYDPIPELHLEDLVAMEAEKKNEERHNDLVDSLIYALGNNKIVINPELSKLMEELKNYKPTVIKPKKRQEKFYLWAYVDRGSLAISGCLYTDKGLSLSNIVFETLYEAISKGRAWKLNPDNPVVLEVEG